ncbi:MAG: hypothetical protein M3N48_11620 [Verrucomicrobiota bacterium]|nr:hypothetical protein [Verrucomicrobiota bacterium]
MSLLSTPVVIGGGAQRQSLALTKDATEVEYKAGVEHVHFRSKATTKTVCAKLTASLKAPGLD